MNSRGAWALLAVLVGVIFAACGSGGGGANPTSASNSAPATASPPSRGAPTLPTATGGSSSSKCPTLAQANAALGASYSGPTSTAGPGGSIICAYAGSAGNAGVTIFAHQSEAVFTGQVANAGAAPGMQKVSGVGDGAFALTAGGRTVVNAWANGSRTVVAAQGPGSLAQIEALARVALSDN